MKTVTLDWSSIHKHGTLWFDHHKLRKKIFVDEYGWDIPHDDKVEWDQYDTPKTTYVITHEHGRVLAATRILPCSLDLPRSSYMIKDATLGRLDRIPENVAESVSEAADDYEITRFTVDMSLSPNERNDALEACSIAAMAYLDSVGARRVYALMPPGFIGWFRKIGIKARRAGPITRNDLGEKFCVLEGSAPFVASPAKTSAAAA